MKNRTIIKSYIILFIKNRYSMHYLIYLILLSSSLMSKDIQIRKSGTMQMQIPVIGIVETSFDHTISNRFYKKIMKYDAESWLASPFIDSETGTIITDGADKVLQYDLEEKEYWMESLEEYFNESDSSAPSEEPVEDDTSSESSWLGEFSWALNGSEFPADVKRIPDPKTITVNGFKTKKWTTTVLDSSNNTILQLEEWFVDTISLKTTYDSLRINLMDRLKPNKKKKKKKSETDFQSSHSIAKLIDENTSIDSLKGYKIKTSMHIYEDDEAVVSVGFELKEYSVSSFDSLYFTVPKKYKLINKTK